jgi:transposase
MSPSIPDIEKLSKKELVQIVKEQKKTLNKNRKTLEEKDKRLKEKSKVLKEKRKILEEKNKILEEKNKALKEKEFFIDRLQHQIEILQRFRFGKKSEKVEVGQLYLFEMEKPLPKYIPEPDIIEDEPEAKQKPKRKKIQENLPRDTVEYEISEEALDCGKCGDKLSRIGQEVLEQYDYVPAKMRVKKTLRHKYACKNKKCSGEVKLADAPAQVIPKSNATAGLLSHILLSKYQYHLPLYRQCEMFRRHGVEFSRSTLSDWVLKCAELLNPVVSHMEKEILKSKYIHTDDTVIPVLDKKRKRTRQGRLWVYIGDKEHPYDIFRYSPDRKGEHPQNVLRDYQGFVHADAYGGYDQIFDKGDASEVACWAHARRKFFDAALDPPKSREIWFIRQLYLIEKEGKSLSAENRRKLRREKSKPVLVQFKNHLENLKVSPKSPLGEARTYTLNQWDALNRYLNDGDLNIDNNPAERAIRPIAVGRKNWLFAGSDRGGKAAAVIASLIATCKRHDVDSYLYLHDALTLMADARKLGEKLSDFTPLAWKQGRKTIEEIQAPDP